MRELLQPKSAAVYRLQPRNLGNCWACVNHSLYNDAASAAYVCAPSHTLPTLPTLATNPPLPTPTHPLPTRHNAPRAHKPTVHPSALSSSSAQSAVSAPHTKTHHTHKHTHTHLAYRCYENHLIPPGQLDQMLPTPRKQESKEPEREEASTHSA